MDESTRGADHCKCSPSVQRPEKLFVKWFSPVLDIEYLTFSYSVYHVQKKKKNRLYGCQLVFDKRRPIQIIVAVLFEKRKLNSTKPIAVRTIYLIYYAFSVIAIRR
uniref:Uncharacterized protein n=1 Tax=Schizaphis graminum TaxID=13262 RepID=A0A2S2PES0_SCHGA